MLNVLKRTLSAVAVGSAATMVLAAAPSTQSGQQPRGSTALRGQVSIDGSSTVYPITEAVASEFGKLFPNVKVTVGISGTGGGFKRFVSGETHISNASRPITAKEFDQAAQNKVGFIELPVAYDGLSIVVNPKNDWVDKLTVDQIKQIYLEKGNGKKWSDLNPAWPEQPIKVYSPGTDSGTFDYFHEVVGKDESFRTDMSTSEDGNVLVTGVSGDPYAIGYFGASYYFNNKDKLKAVPVVNPETGDAVLPSNETVNNGSYAPFSRPLFIYVNADALRRPEIKAFVDFYMSKAPELAKQVDYTPLPQELYQLAVQFQKDKSTGTAYLTPDGQKREGALAEVYRKENLRSPVQ